LLQRCTKELAPFDAGAEPLRGIARQVTMRALDSKETSLAKEMHD
jgi:hypothetical protein